MEGITTVTCGSGWARLYEPIVERCKAAGVAIDSIIERAGGLRIFVDTTAAEEQLWAAIDAAEAASFGICEQCGGDQDITTGGHDYVRTLCKQCREKHETPTVN